MKRDALRQRGFTLVEVMISIALLATLTALMWASISSMFNSRDAIKTRTDRYQQVRVTMDRMATEISAAYMAGPEFGGEELPGEETFEEQEKSAEDAVAEAANYQEPIQFGMIGRDDEIHFTSFGHVRTMDGEKTSHHAEISYFIRSARNEEGRMVDMLMRREDATMDDELERGGVIYKMLPEIESMKIEYWDPGEVELGTYEEIAQGRWVSSWDTTRREHAGRLPQRVRITLTLPPQGLMRDSESFTTQAEIAVTEVLEF